ncbi:MAG TPA: acetyl-CoA carboxylase, carboxyltransferase subunit beta [Candidatus Acidoferrales bacterium]|nr:acetyl-CoA carboxylase, carboxyltransferase subunit beta [Candidatus Acidoferrales bacterium]
MPDWLRVRKNAQAQDAAQWTKCSGCGELVYKPDLKANHEICPKCGYYFRMHAADRLSMLLDGDFIEVGGDIEPGDPLKWVDKKPYPEKLASDRAKSGLSEAVVAGFGAIGGFQVGIAVMDFHFRGGTMGTVVGDRVALLFEHARERKVPAVVFSASGGARMEEGVLALMQLAKTTNAVERFRRDGLSYISVLTDPTTGGVSASFAFQADVIVAETRAAIGFAGRRVIEQTIRQKLPENFQRAEFLLEHGAIDMVIERPNLRDTLVRLLDYGIAAPRGASRNGALQGGGST